MKPSLSFTFEAFLVILYVLIPLKSLAQHRVIHSDIDGVPLVRTEGGPKYLGRLFELESDLILGIDEGEPEWQLFSYYPMLLVADDGKMVLADKGRHEVYIVSSDGELLSRFGHRGSGPSEFENIFNIIWAERGEEFWIEDQMLSRISRFDMEGTYLGSFSYAEQRLHFDLIQGFGNRRFLALASGHNNEPNDFGLLDELLVWTTDICSIQGQQFQSVSSAPGGGLPIPFINIGGMTAYPDGRSIAYYPYEPKLTVFDSLGRPILHIKRDWEMRLVTNEEKQHWLERFRNSPNPAIQEHVRRVNFPRRHGAFIKAYPDDQGRIWLHTRDESDESGDSSATRRIIELYSSAGEWLGVQDISFRPLMIHRGAIYRTYLPEYGAARIERLKIIPLVPELTDSR